MKFLHAFEPVAAIATTVVAAPAYSAEARRHST